MRSLQTADGEKEQVVPRLVWTRWSGPEILFYPLLALYIRYGLDPRMLYHAFGIVVPYPTFRTGWAFFQEHLHRPGGMVEYLGALLSHGFNYSWVGTVIIAGSAWLIWAGTRRLIAVVSGGTSQGGPLWLAYLPVVLLLATYNGFEHPVASYDRYPGPLTSSVGLVVALWFAVGQAALPVRGRDARAIAFIALSALAHFAAGGGSLHFALLTAIHEVSRRRWLTSAVCLLLGVAIPAALSGYAYDLIIADGCTRLLPWSYWTKPWSYVYAVCTYLSVPAVVALAAARRRLPLPRSLGSLAVVPGPPARLLAPLLLAILGLAVSFDGFRRDFLQITQLSRQQRWSEVVERAKELPPGGFQHPYFHRETLRALYHSGRLGDELFSFPHRASGRTVPFLSLPRDREPQLWDHAQIADLALELGDVNRAEHFAHELLEGAGEGPAVVHKLALINMVKGQTETARVFLNAQSEYLVGGGQGRSLLRRLEEDPGLDSDERVQQLRAVIFLEDDVAFIEKDPEDAESVETLIALLQRNKRNRMAFEYLLARYLMSGQAARVVENLGRLADFGYREIPRHYEEAVLVHELATGARVNVPGFAVSEDARRRFAEFKRISRQFRNNPGEAMSHLAPRFGHSFFFYRTFGQSGV